MTKEDGDNYKKKAEQDVSRQQNVTHHYHVALLAIREDTLVASFNVLLHWLQVRRNADFRWLYRNNNRIMNII